MAIKVIHGENFRASITSTFIITNFLLSSAICLDSATIGFKSEKGEIFFNTVVPGGGALPYMGYIGMCRREGYGFQAVYSRIGYINQGVWV